MHVVTTHPKPTLFLLPFFPNRMIAAKETISLSGFPLFTKLKLETPLVGELNLPSQACYVYIVAGSGQKLVPSENGTARSGQVILSLCGLTAGKMLSQQTRGSIKSIIVHFDRELLRLVFEGAKPTLWKELEIPVTQYVVQSAAGQLVKSYFEGIARLFDHSKALTDTLLKLKLQEIILLLLQTDNGENVRNIIKSLFSERTFTFRELVNAHIFTSATIEDLAVLTNCSLSTFKRRFKQIYNTAPGKYISEKRIEKVAHLLKVSDDAISSIGYESGFDSPEHLSRAFKKKFGLSPSEYRLNRLIK